MIRRLVGLGLGWGLFELLSRSDFWYEYLDGDSTSLVGLLVCLVLGILVLKK